MAKRNRRFRASGEQLWVFAQYPAASTHLVIPVLATSREAAIRLLESDPRRLGKPLTATTVAGRPGVTDGTREFIVFDDADQCLQFLVDELWGVSDTPAMDSAGGPPG